MHRFESSEKSLPRPSKALAGKFVDAVEDTNR